ncbi:MAG: hypothetical protein ACLP5H_23240 [Desulfomonilaceae bacterium]
MAAAKSKIIIEVSGNPGDVKKYLDFFRARMEGQIDAAMIEAFWPEMGAYIPLPAGFDLKYKYEEECNG